jgi:hypothetical protein
MKKTIQIVLLSIVVIAFSSVHAKAQNHLFDAFGEKITVDLLYKHLSVLASDSLLGRGTGQEGKQMAADYLAYYLQKFGYPEVDGVPGFFQHFDLNATSVTEINYTLTRHGDPQIQWQATSSRGISTEIFNMFGNEQSLSGEIVFGGLGIMSESGEINHLRDKDVNGKWVLIFGNLSDESNEIDAELMDQRVMSLLFRQRARGVLVVNHTTQEDFENEAEKMSRIIGNPSGIRLPDGGGRGGFSVGVKSVSPNLASKILNFENHDQLYALFDRVVSDYQNYVGFETKYSLSVEANRQDIVIPSVNVLGFLEGCHEVLKNELVVLSAHYDHMGIGVPDENGDMIYNGADDNGSGTVTTLVLADALMQAKNEGFCLDRSVLFLFVAAEEHGLLGSRYYSDNPVFPIENTIANFNLDMFGRIDYEYQDTDQDYVYIIGASIISSALDSLLHVANERSVNIKLDMKYNDLDDRNQFYRRSDHWNFGRLGVPFIFFFSGLHDDYHEPSDSVDKIAFELLEKRARLIYTTLIEVANAPERPVVDNQEFINRTRLPRR